MNEGINNVLDEGFIGNVSPLSNYQLVGFINEEVRYSSVITDKVKEEIERRNIPKEELMSLSKRYTSNGVVAGLDLKVNIRNIVVLFLLILIGVFLVPKTKVIAELIVVIISLKGVQLRFKKGRGGEDEIWRCAQLSFAIMTVIAIGIAFLL